MTIENDKKYKLTGEQIKDLASRFGVLSGEIGDLANLTTTDKSNLVAAINEAATGGGGVIELTSADYNWNSISGESGTPDTIALWKLDAGVYSWDDLVRTTDYSGTGYATQAGICIVSVSSSYSSKTIIKWTSNGTTRFIVDNPTTGESTIWKYMLSSTSTKDNLTSTSTTEPLSANQGKVLKDLVDSLAIRGAGAPTTSTVGQVGTLYEDTTNGKLYQCTDTTGGSYTWVEVGAGGGSGGITELTSADYDYPTDNPVNIALWNLQPGVYTSAYGVYVKPTVSTTAIGSGSIVLVSATQDNSRKSIYVFDGSYNDIHYVTTSTGGLIDAEWLIGTKDLAQTSGNSQTQAMSQNATTSMVFADPSAKSKVQIGNNAVTSGAGAASIGGATRGTGNYSVAIGNTTRATGANSVALGSGADASQKGQFDISTSFSGSTLGYNDTQYRLLTGLYDPQSAHDAATKGYVDPTTDSSAPTSATVGRLGQIQIDTTNADAYMCVAVDSVTPSYTWKQITA